MASRAGSNPTTTKSKTADKSASSVNKTPTVKKVIADAESSVSYVPQKGEEYMSPAQLTHFEKLLKDWKASISQNSIDALNSLQADSGSMADLNDRASLEEEFALTLRSQDRERRLILKINKALERISADDFGFCNRCGAEIGIKRLEARLTAELCIDCKEIEEKRERTLQDNIS